jgi:hypothetical protein
MHGCVFSKPVVGTLLISISIKDKYMDRFEILKAIERWYENIKRTRKFEPETDKRVYDEVRTLIKRYSPGEGCIRLPDGTITDKGFFESQFPGLDDDKPSVNEDKRGERKAQIKKAEKSDSR